MTAPIGPASPNGDHMPPPGSGEHLTASPDQRIVGLLLETFPLEHAMGESEVIKINVTDPTDVALGSHPDHEVNAQLTKWPDRKSPVLDQLEVGWNDNTTGVRTNLMFYSDSSGQVQLRKRTINNVTGQKQEDTPRPVTDKSIESDLAEISQGMEPWLSESTDQSLEPAEPQT